MIALRSLLRTRGLTMVAVATLALGIGATTTIFTVVNGVLLRPLAYADPGRLVMIWNDFGVGAQSLPAVSPGDFRDYQLRSKTFEAIKIVNKTRLCFLSHEVDYLSEDRLGGSE